MLTKLIKIENESALILDNTLMDSIGLAEGGHVQLEVHDGSLVITPAVKTIGRDEFEAAVEQTIKKYGNCLRRLAE